MLLTSEITSARPPSTSLAVLAALVVSLLGLAAVPARAQIANLTDATSTPIVISNAPVGHSFLGATLPGDTGALNALRVFGGTVREIVSPASGGVSWRICVAAPKGRGLSLPFCFDYDSEGVHHLASVAPGNLQWESNASYLAQGGWNYGLPMLSEVRRQDLSGGRI